MDNSSIIPYLFGVTLLMALCFGIYQFFRTKKAQQTHERSAAAVANHEPRTAQARDNPARAASARPSDRAP